MTYGVTATRKSITLAQIDVARELVRGAEALHHGDCIGGDDQCHTIALELEIPLIDIHPPSDPTLRAWCNRRRSKTAKTLIRVRKPKPFLARNRDIVMDTNRLIVLPEGFDEVLRSGTWATKRFAENRRRPFIIVYPDGSTDTERYR